METLNDKKKGFKVPHTFVLLALFVMVMAILTYVIPAGSYERFYDEATGRELVNPDSFTTVERTPVTFIQFLTSFTLGMQGVADVIFCVFVTGGMMEILNATGAIDRGVASLANSKFIAKAFVPVFCFVFGMGGATYGMSDELVVFVPIGIAIAHALGYDALVGLAATVLGAAVGFNAGFLNPFSTGIAQAISGLPMYSGIWLRLVIFAVYYVITVWFIVRYAKKVKKDPSKSIVKDCKCETERQDLDVSALDKMTGRDKGVLLVFVGGILLMVYGLFVWGWYIDEMTGVFLAMGVIGGLIGKLNLDTIAEKFVDGCAGLTFGALSTGFAKAIVIVMEDGQILDTIIHGLSSVVLVLPEAIAVLGMYVVQILISIVIPSSTGQAATVMPIVTPIADIVGITRQTAVLCFQFADGFSNSIIPTSSVTLSYLAVAKIPFEKWVKFLWPLFTIWVVLGAVFLVFANAINYGPF
ncbi:MAG: YfcC family protein [Clostridiales bacterium]|nr:YfcC family protein [Clostridiales bacterium]